VTWEQLKPELNVALNEATLLGFEVDADRRLGGATFSVLTLPVTGPTPDDARIQLLFSPVGRVAASLRLGRWNDPNAELVPFELAQLLREVQNFGGLPIYGWEFFDVHEEELARWDGRVSLDWRSGSDGTFHSIRVFQEHPANRYLSLIVWFDKLSARHPDGTAISLKEFTSGGRRWWDALYAGDARTAGRGINPLPPAKSDG
jgi:hypothetical protein